MDNDSGRDSIYCSAVLLNVHEDLLGSGTYYTRQDTSYVATVFAAKVNGAPVLVSDGTVYHAVGADYTSKNDFEYRKWRRRVKWYSLRGNEGWMVYQQTENRLEISDSYGKDLFLSEMVSIGSYYNSLRCEER